MLATIDFDDNSELVAGKVSKVSSDRGFASKVVLFEWRLPQILPKLFFGFGGVTTQSTGTRNAFIDGASLRHPPPTPDPSPPQAGGGAKLHALFQSQIQNSAFLV